MFNGTFTWDLITAFDDVLLVIMSAERWSGEEKIASEEHESICVIHLSTVRCRVIFVMVFVLVTVRNV